MEIVKNIEEKLVKLCKGSKKENIEIFIYIAIVYVIFGITSVSYFFGVEHDSVKIAGVLFLVSTAVMIGVFIITKIEKAVNGLVTRLHDKETKG